MKTLADIKRRIVVGTRLLTVENTSRNRDSGKSIDGSVREVVRVLGNSFVSHVEGLEGDFWTHYPKASDVTIVDADTFRFALMEGHYVELRFLQ